MLTGGLTFSKVGTKRGEVEEGKEEGTLVGAVAVCRLSTSRHLLSHLDFTSTSRLLHLSNTSLLSLATTASMPAPDKYAWDLHRKPEQEPADDGGGWQVVGSSAKSQSKSEPPQRAYPPKRTSPAPSTRGGRGGGRGGKQQSLATRQRQPRPRQHAPWQNIDGGAVRSQLPRAPQNLIEDDSDNDAQEQWRAHEQPKGMIRIALVLLANDSERPHIIAKQNRAFLAASTSESKGGESHTFGLWGEPQAVADARAAINEWIAQAMGQQPKNGKFAKLASLTPKLRTREENRWMREVKRQRYRQHPPMVSNVEG